LRLIVHTHLGNLPADGIKWKHNRERLVTLPSTSLLADELDTHTDSEWVYVRVDNNESLVAEGEGGFARTTGSFGPRVVAAESSEGMVPSIEAEGLQLNVHRLVHGGDGLIAVKLIKSVSD
jgi:hypothetical protein